MALLQDLLQHIKKQYDTLKGLLPVSEEQQRKLDTKFRLEFNYNSNHLEGNTLTYGETELLLLFDQTTGTHELREYEEMKAHDVALKMVVEEAADHERPLTEQFIRSLNKHLLVRDFWKEAVTIEGQSTRKKIVPGEYKRTPNSVRLQNGEIFHYTTPERVAEEMSELVAWFNAHMETEDPVILAALLHYRFVRIHPFDDGNGRVARLLMNYVLLKRGYPVVVIKSDDKKQYLAALNKADSGDIPAFTAHIAEQVIWSFDLWLKAAHGGSIEEEDDLDKELALLKKELDRKPNKFEKKKSKVETRFVFNDSMIPLARALDDKLEALRPYFVSVDVSVYLRVTNEAGSQSSSTSFSIKDLQKRSESFLTQYPGINGAYIEVNCNALKAADEKVDIIKQVHIRFDDFHYLISDLSTKELLVKRAYGQKLANTDLKVIVDYVVRYILREIKNHTGLQ